MEISGKLHIPAACLLAEKPGTHWTREWVAPEAVWTFWSRKTYCPSRSSNIGSSRP